MTRHPFKPAGLASSSAHCASGPSSSTTITFHPSSARHWHQTGSYSNHLTNVCFTLIRDYFPIELIKTADLKPEKNYIFCYHPHGVISLGAISNFATEATGFSEKFPGKLIPQRYLPGAPESHAIINRDRPASAHAEAQLLHSLRP